MSKDETIQLAKQTKEVTQAQRVEVVGSWIWVYFESKPNDQTREWLTIHKFHWNSRRLCWQYAGEPSKKSPADTHYLRMKYGAMAIQAKKDESNG